MELRWRDFKTDPPYDAKNDEEAGYETDRVHAWFTWRHTHRASAQINLSYRACEFYDGIFTEYKSAMRTSPYACDWIEIISWVDADDVRELLRISINQP